MFQVSTSTDEFFVTKTQPSSFPTGAASVSVQIMYMKKLHCSSRGNIYNIRFEKFQIICIENRVKLKFIHNIVYSHSSVGSNMVRSTNGKRLTIAVMWWHVYINYVENCAPSERDLIMYIGSLRVYALHVVYCSTVVPHTGNGSANERTPPATGSRQYIAFSHLPTQHVNTPVLRVPVIYHFIGADSSLYYNANITCYNRCMFGWVRG